MLKRGTAEAWKRNNPVLAKGEPGFEIDTNRLKIGTGEKAWNDLKYQDSNSVYEVSNFKDLPSSGVEYTIYKVSSEKALYQWNSNIAQYELLSSNKDYNDITIINGGNANGTA